MAVTSSRPGWRARVVDRTGRQRGRSDSFVCTGVHSPRGARRSAPPCAHHLRRRGKPVAPPPRATRRARCGRGLCRPHLAGGAKGAAYEWARSCRASVACKAMGCLAPRCTPRAAQPFHLATLEPAEEQPRGWASARAMVTRRAPPSGDVALTLALLYAGSIVQVASFAGCSCKAPLRPRRPCAEYVPRAQRGSLSRALAPHTSCGCGAVESRRADVPHHAAVPPDCAHRVCEWSLATLAWSAAGCGWRAWLDRRSPLLAGTKEGANLPLAQSSNGSMRGSATLGFKRMGSRLSLPRKRRQYRFATAARTPRPWRRPPLAARGNSSGSGCEQTVLAFAVRKVGEKSTDLLTGLGTGDGDQQR